MLSPYQQELQRKKLGLKEPKEKKQKPISARSVKRLAEEKLYAQKKKKYLTEHIKCEVKGCNRVSVDLHHKKGREGKMLYNEKFFMGVCREHHSQITNNPYWALENGYSIKRLKITE
jgi:hypothetical protein